MSKAAKPNPDVPIEEWAHISDLLHTAAEHIHDSQEMVSALLRIAKIWAAIPGQEEQAYRMALIAEKPSPATSRTANWGPIIVVIRGFEATQPDLALRGYDEIAKLASRNSAIVGFCRTFKEFLWKTLQETSKDKTHGNATVENDTLNPPATIPILHVLVVLRDLRLIKNKDDSLANALIAIGEILNTNSNYAQDARDAFAAAVRAAQKGSFAYRKAVNMHGAFRSKPLEALKELAPDPTNRVTRPKATPGA